MPELPEVETICQTLRTAILDQKIVKVIVGKRKLREPIPDDLVTVLPGKIITNVSRRGRYILIHLGKECLIIHLGMSGNLRLESSEQLINRHDHFRILLSNHYSIHYIDPRRFGFILWTMEPVLQHKILKKLGIEPLDDKFRAEFLFDCAQGKKYTIKQLLMDNQLVTGIGNIYANEILFASKINPLRKANEISLNECARIVDETKRILQLAIQAGGTTIRDHSNVFGKKGSFQEQLAVYGKAGQPCPVCKTKLVSTKISQRATVFCSNCQKIERNIKNGNSV